MSEERRCQVTGLQLIREPRGYSFHVGENDYPPLSAVPRSATDKFRQAWGRYDVPGQTLYVAQTSECAYAEVLSPFKRANGSADPLTKDAAALGLTLEEFIEEIAHDWSDRDFMGLGAIPAVWRFDRGMVAVVLPEHGWFVDIEHPDSISTIEQLMGDGLASYGVAQLTTGTLRSDDRVVTTAIAQRLHHVILDTGYSPLGIHFGSKHGAGWCKAVWLDHLDSDNLLALAPDPILSTDSALKTVADRLRIRVF